MSSRNRLFWTLALISVLAISMVACSSPAPSSQPAPAPPAPSTSAAAPTTTTAPTPASPKPATTTSAPATTTSPAASPAAAAQTAAQFYGKNVLTLYTATAGGGSDFLSRLFATYWSQKVEGGLARVINNQGGSQRASLSDLQKAKPDGLGIQVIGEIEAPVLLGDPSAKYDPTALIFIGVVAPAPGALWLSPKAPHKTADDLKGASGYIFGNASLINADSIACVYLASVLEMKNPRLVTGYTGGQELGLALARGEINGVVIGAATGRDLVTTGLSRGAAIVIDTQKSAWFPDSVPLASALAAKLTPEQQMLLDVCVGMQGVANKIVTTPGVPQDRVDFLRDVFMNKIITDKNFLAQVALRYPVWDKPMTGVEYAVINKKIMSTSKETIDKIKVMVSKMAGL